MCRSTIGRVDYFSTASYYCGLRYIDRAPRRRERRGRDRALNQIVVARPIKLIPANRTCSSPSAWLLRTALSYYPYHKGCFRLSHQPCAVTVDSLLTSCLLILSTVEYVGLSIMIHLGVSYALVRVPMHPRAKEG